MFGIHRYSSQFLLEFNRRAPRFHAFKLVLTVECAMGNGKLIEQKEYIREIHIMQILNKGFQFTIESIFCHEKGH